MKLLSIDFRVVCEGCGFIYHKVYYIGQSRCEFLCPECGNRGVFDYVDIDCSEEWDDDE